MKKIVLASGSKLRQDIFNMIGFQYDVVKSLVEESSNQSDPSEYVKDLSRDKAHSVETQLEEKAIIIAADTIIYMNGKIYEKPKTKQEAFENIKEMIGKTSYAVTGVTIKDLYQEKEICFTDVCEVTFKSNINDNDIRWYVDHEKTILDRCGYAIVGKAAIFIEKINGDHNTVFGISPSKLHNKLKELGYELSDFELQ